MYGDTQAPLPVQAPAFPRFLGFLNRLRTDRAHIYAIDYIIILCFFFLLPAPLFFLPVVLTRNHLIRETQSLQSLHIYTLVYKINYINRKT